MENVADNDDVGTVEAGAGFGDAARVVGGAEMAAQRHGIQERLSRMLVGAVTRVEDREIHPPGVSQAVSRTRG